MRLQCSIHLCSGVTISLPDRVQIFELPNKELSFAGVPRLVQHLHQDVLLPRMVIRATTHIVVSGHQLSINFVSEATYDTFKYHRYLKQVQERQLAVCFPLHGELFGGYCSNGPETTEAPHHRGSIQR